MKISLAAGSAVLLMLLLVARAEADTLNIAYGDDSKQKLDVYSGIGHSDAAGFPVVIWVHGGGWRHGDKSNRSGMNLCQRWASAGQVIVNLNYRLTPDVVHPAHVQDVAAAIAWVHKNIAKYGGNPKKVFLLGHSAGAHLVALVATNPRYLAAHDLIPKSAIAGVMPIDTASFDLNSTRTLAVRKMISDAFGNDRETLMDASPLVQANRHRDQVPPFIIAVVKQRPEALDESRAFKQVLPKCELIVMDYPNSGQLKAHAQIAVDLLDLNNKMTKQLIAFVQSAQ